MAIEGVLIKPRQVHSDERGRLMEVLRRDDPDFRSFADDYLGFVGQARTTKFGRSGSDALFVLA